MDRSSSRQDWIGAVGAKTAYIERGSPWENGFIESFNARLSDELLDGEIVYSLAEARIVIESWRRHYNTERPHGSWGYKPTAPEVFIPALAARASSQPRPAQPPARRQPNHQLTFAPDQSLGADQSQPVAPLSVPRQTLALWVATQRLQTHRYALRQARQKLPVDRLLRCVPSL